MYKKNITLLVMIFAVYFTNAQTDTIKKTIDIDEIVISASRFPENKNTVPYKIETINSKTIQFQNNQTSADLIQNSGTAFVQKSQGGGGSPVIRGFEANKILIVVDGVRMNNAVFRGGHLQNVLTVDQFILDKTEITFGPNSLIYGSDALGGVMHFISKNPTLSLDNKSVLNANAALRFASANLEKTGHFDFSIGFKKIGFLTSVTFSDFDDLRQGKVRKNSLGNLGLREYYVERLNGKDTMIKNDHPEIQKFTGYQQYDLMEKIVLQPNATNQHTLNMQFSNSTQIPRYDRLTDDADQNGILDQAEYYYGPQTRLLTAYRFERTKSCILADKLSIQPAFQYIEESRHDRKFNNPKLRNRNEKITVYSINTDAEKNWKKQKFNYGIEFTHNRVSSNANNKNLETGEVKTTSTRYPEGGSTMNNLGIYLTHTSPLSSWLYIKDGLRWSYIDLKSDFEDKSIFPFPYDEAHQQNNALSGNLGLVATPAKGWQINLLGSTGFRAPNVDDLSKVFDSGNGTLIVPNPSLKPEYTYNAELGLEKKINSVFSFNLTGYYTLFKNAIVTDKFNFNGKGTLVYDGDTCTVLANVNKQKAFIYGLDGGIEINLLKKIRLTSILHYTYGRIDTDTADYPLDHIPPLFGRTGIQYNGKKLTVEFWTLYNATKPIKEYYLNGEDNEQYATPDGMPSWVTFNLRASYKIYKYIEVQAGVENLLDTSYRTFASGINAAGRNYILALRGSF